MGRANQQLRANGPLGPRAGKSEQVPAFEPHNWVDCRTMSERSELPLARPLSGIKPASRGTQAPNSHQCMSERSAKPLARTTPLYGTAGLASVSRCLPTAPKAAGYPHLSHNWVASSPRGRAPRPCAPPAGQRPIADTINGEATSRPPSASEGPSAFGSAQSPASSIADTSSH